MPVGRIAAAVAAAIAALAPASGQTPPPRNSISLDLYTFEQKDDGGNPLQAEGFRYNSATAAVKLQLNAEEAMRLEVNFAAIDNQLPQPVPPTVANVATTSASTDLTTLDFFGGLDIKRLDSPLKASYGLYYHHQIDNVGAGFDYGLTRSLDQGNTELSARYRFRYDWVSLNYWDGGRGGADNRFTHNLQLGWTELLSTSLKSNLNLQYTRQDGFLSETYNFVALNSGGQPSLYTDEQLPDSRNRLQLNGRLRYSWKIGSSLGVDASAYRDDWDIQHFAVEPSLETPLLDNLSWRVWYRLAHQDGTEYFRPAPTALSRYQTQDSDLGSFRSHSPGTTLSLRVRKTADSEWRLRLSVYGFDRNDGISGLGGNFGMAVTW